MSGASVWSEQAEALADWTLSREVVRRDVFGAYRPGGGTYTAHEALDRAVLIEHYRGVRIIGAHSTNPDNVCRWVACDIDAHDDKTDKDRNWECALAVSAGFSRYGLNPLILDSNGRGGYHVKAWFKHALDAAIARWICDQLNVELSEAGFVPLEWFPKQAGLTLDTPFGNWLRISGKHHRHDHWTRVYDTASPGWLEGRDAIRRLLAVAGDKTEAIKKAYAEAHPGGNDRKARETHRGGHQAPPGPHDVERARDALTHIPNDGDGLPYDSWLALGMALAALGEAGRELWHAFSKRSNKYNEAETDRKFASFSSSGNVTLGTLFYWAKQHGWTPPPDPDWRQKPSGNRNGRSHEDQPSGSTRTPPRFEKPPRALGVELLPVPELDPRMLPDIWRPWLCDIADRGCFPLEYPVAAAICAFGSLIGKRLCVRPKRHDQWLVPLNLWGALVGPPGIQKTPAAEEAMRPIKRLVADALDDHEKVVKEHLEACMVCEAKANAAKDKLRKAAKQGADDEKLRSLAAEMREAESPAGPQPRRYVVNDTTVEKLGELLAHNPSLLLFRDELTGFLRTLERQGHEGDKGFYLECWNGLGSYVYDRIGRGTIFIPNVCMSLFGGIQPGPLGRYLRGAASGEDCDGFMPRFQVLVYPDPPAEFSNVDRWPASEAKNRAFALFKAAAFDRSQRGCEFDEDRQVAFLGFDEFGQEFFDAWRTELETRLRSGDETPLMAAHLSKFRGFMPALALLFHLTEHLLDAGPIPRVGLYAAERGAAWCEFFEAHARRIYQSAYDGDIEAAQALGARIKQSLPNPFTFRQVAQKGWAGLGTVEDVRRAVGQLEDRGWVQVEEIPSGPAGGRPSEVVWIHPAIRGEQPA
jgi:putative DNA primase/helicase